MMSNKEAHELIMAAAKNSPFNQTLSFELEAMNMVQLDAFKAGAEWAARRVAIFGDTMDIKIHSELLYLTAERVVRMTYGLKEIPE